MSEQWVAVATVDSLAEGEVVPGEIDGKHVALYLVDGVVHATGGLCSHRAVKLCGGFLEGHEIECPLHQARFDIRSGRVLCAPATADIPVYPVKVDGDKVLVLWAFA